MGLDQNQFGIVRSNILALKPLPNLNKAYSMVLSEESKQRISNGMEARVGVEVAAFKESPTTRSTVGPRPRCTHCQKLGHDRSQCFKLIGYPKNWAGRRLKRGQNRQNLVQNQSSTGV